MKKVKLEIGKRKMVGPIVYFLFSIFAFSLLLWADATADLRPTADGGSEQWTNNAGTACSAATCYTEVNESSGANCTTTPGDATVNKSSTTANRVQTYDLDLSSIPANSTVQSALVSGCLKRGGTNNANFRFLVRIDAVVTNCGSSSTSTSAFADFNCTIDFTDFSKGSQDFEIGVENIQARDVHLTALKAAVTYAPPGQPPLRRRLIVYLRPSPSSTHPAR